MTLGVLPVNASTLDKKKNYMENTYCVSNYNLMAKALYLWTEEEVPTFMRFGGSREQVIPKYDPGFHLGHVRSHKMSVLKAARKQRNTDEDYPQSVVHLIENNKYDKFAGAERDFCKVVTSQ